MSWFRRLANTLRPARTDRDIERELAFHIAERIDHLREEGMTEREAQRRARLQFGNPAVEHERTRDVDIVHHVDTVLRRTRYAIRSLLRTPGFTVTVVLTLALGIGANSSVFSVIDAVLLRPLPFPDSDRLMRVRQAQQTESAIAPPRLEDWNRRTSSFDALSGYYIEEVSDTTADLPQRLRRAVVAPRFFDVLRVSPMMGQAFVGDESGPGAASVLISHRYWRTRLDADPRALGTVIRIEDRLFSIVGVLPADFAFPDREVDLWWPYPLDGPLTQNTANNRRLQWYTGIGRLKPGVSRELALEDLTVVQEQLGKEYPDTDAAVAIRIVPLGDTVGGDVRSSLWLLFGAVSLLLLIACTNIAALLLSRTTRRENEIAIRISLGASRTAIAAELFTEITILAFAGAAAGLLVAAGAWQAFLVFAPRLPRLEAIGIEPRMLIYTMASTVVVVFVCGLLPAVRGARHVASIAREGARSSRHTVQWALVGVQVALSVTLLSGAGLLVRSLDALSRVEPGFDASRILAFRLSGNWSENYADPAGLVNRIDTTLNELAALPNIDAVATSWTLPGAPGPLQIEFDVAEGRSAPEPRLIAAWRTVSPGYFQTMGIRLLSGELCRSQIAGIHRPGATLDLMVNRSFADQYFAGRSPVGTRMSWDAGSLAGRVTGIVDNARELGIDHAPVPTVYTCDSAPNPFPWFVARARNDPNSIAGTVRHRLSQLEPLRSVYDMAPLADRIGDAYAQNRLRTWLLTAFAVTALSLVCAGVYGTLSYAASRRRREVALRLALGALRHRVVQDLMATSVRIVGLSSALGLGLALIFTQSLSSMLYGVSPADPLTLAGVIAVVAGVAFFAALVPAARAAFMQPMRTLREE